MRNTSSEVDVYIARSADFAKPILTKVRRLFHEACPEIQETMKWSFPHFEYKGIVGSMAAFKRHAAFGFWKGGMMKDPHGLLKGMGKTEMGSMKVTDVAQIPSDAILIAYIQEAVRLNEQGVKAPRPAAPKTRKAIDVPGDLAAALKKHPKARMTFESFSPSHRREYVEWVSEAKQEATRVKRLATAIEWMSEGKPRHWKYAKVPR